MANLRGINYYPRIIRINGVILKKEGHSRIIRTSIVEF